MINKNKKKLANAIALVCCSTSAIPVYAQEQQIPDLEYVVVTGIRQSLAKSISIKRESTGLVDAVVAEDIGKFPDANVAESLQRIPGVYLERDGASNEGNRITIRGLGSSYAVTTINGAPVHTTSGMNVGTSTRDFNYDVFPSELFGQVKVYKSAMAELTEGGIGGTVDLQTPRPFDGNGRIARYTVNASYNDASEETNPKASFLYGDTWENFGALLGVAYAKSANTRSGYQSTGQYNTGALGRERKGPFRFEIDYDDPRVNLGGLTQEQVDGAFLPRFHRAYAAQNERERVSAVTSFQFKNDNLDVSLDSLMANLVDARDEYTFGVAIRNSGQGSVQGIVPIDVYIDENNNLFGKFGNTTYFSESFPYDSETDFSSHNLRANYTITDTLGIRAQLTSSKSEASLSSNKIFTQADGVTSVIDSSRSTIYPTLTYDRDFTDPMSWNLGLDLGYEYRNETDDDKMGLVEVKWDYGISNWDGTLKVGLSKNISIKESLLKNGTSIGKNQILANGKSFSQMTLTEFASYMDTTMPIRPYAQSAGDDFPKTWSSFSRATINGFFEPKRANAAAPIDYNATFTAEEDVTSFYLQTDLKGDVLGRQLGVNVGVRFSDTEVTADNYTLDEGSYIPNKTTGGYDTVLPSLNVYYDVHDDVVVRGSIGKTITRVGLNRIAANVLIENPFNAAASAGNPNLTPEEALSKDLSIEWYFAEGGLLSVGAFWKEIKDQPITSQSIVKFGDLGLPDTVLGPIFIDPATGRVSPDLDITLDSYVNGADQDLKGYEIAYQQNFTFLPEPFDGFGALASYTNVDTQSADWISNSGVVYDIPSVPEHGYTFATFYEKGPLALRVSYAYKSEKYTDLINRGNDLNRVQVGVGYLDASIGYQITDDLEIRLEGSNLNNVLEYVYYPNPAGLYGDGKSRKNDAFYSGRVYTLGLRGSF